MILPNAADSYTCTACQKVELGEVHGNLQLTPQGWVVVQGENPEEIDLFCTECYAIFIEPWPKRICLRCKQAFTTAYPPRISFDPRKNYEIPCFQWCADCNAYVSVIMRRKDSGYGRTDQVMTDPIKHKNYHIIDNKENK